MSGLRPRVASSVLIMVEIGRSRFHIRKFAPEQQVFVLGKTKGQAKMPGLRSYRELILASVQLKARASGGPARAT
jgi:hypothetical protein